VPGEVDVGVEQRHVHARRRAAGQLLLGGAYVVPEHPVPAPGRLVGRLGELPPALGIGGAERLAEVVDDRAVEVQPTDVIEPVAGDDVPPVVRPAAQHARVEGAATQVVDDERGARRDHPAEYAGEVERGGDRFGDQRDTGHAGTGGRVGEGGLAA